MQSVLTEVALTPDKPSKYLPHRFPFLFLDSIKEINPGIAARAEKLVTSAPEGFPPILLIECIAQLAGIAASQQGDEGGFLASIDHAEFFGQAQTGDLIEIEARIIKQFGRLCLVEGHVACRGQKLASAAMTLGIGRL